MTENRKRESCVRHYYSLCMLSCEPKECNGICEHYVKREGMSKKINKDIRIRKVGTLIEMPAHLAMEMDLDNDDLVIVTTEIELITGSPTEYLQKKYLKPRSYNPRPEGEQPSVDGALKHEDKK